MKIENYISKMKQKILNIVEKSLSNILVFEYLHCMYTLYYTLLTLYINSQHKIGIFLNYFSKDDLLMG